MRRNILIVDDDKSFQELASFYLEHAGYDISLCTDGHSALLELQKDQTDLLLLDISMPHMNGITALRNIRKNEKTKEIPVIIVTSNGDLSTISSVIRNGCDDIITKPVEKSVFLNKVQLALNNAPAYHEFKVASDDISAECFLELKFKIKSLSARGMEIQTDIPLPGQFIIDKMINPYFDKIGLKKWKMKVVECVLNENKKYNCYLKFIQTPDEDVEKLRIWILENYHKNSH